MREPRVRLAFLALILGLPVLIGLMAQPGSQVWGLGPFGRTWVASPSLVLAAQVEPLLIAGLLYADGQRRRLLNDLAAVVEDEG